MSAPRGPIVLDQLFASVTPLRTLVAGSSRPHRAGSATGFFFQHNGKKFLVTSRHVVINENQEYFPDTVVIRVHTSSTDLTQNREITLPLYSEGRPLWLEHPTGRSNFDVAAIKVDEVVRPEDVILFLGSDRFLPQNATLDLSADLIVIGYPMRFYDETLNLPIVRDATLASAYPVPFQGRPIFLIDANLHAGTSGSPVVRKSSTSQTVMTDSGLEVKLGNFPSYLLGMNSGEFNSEGAALGLHQVWYARLIQEIIEGQGSVQYNLPSH